MNDDSKMLCCHLLENTDGLHRFILLMLKVTHTLGQRCIHDKHTF